MLLTLHWQGWSSCNRNCMAVTVTPNVYCLSLEENFLILLHVNHSRAPLQVDVIISNCLLLWIPSLTTHSMCGGWNSTIWLPNSLSSDQMPTGQSPNSPSMEQTHPTLPSCKSLRPMALNSLLVSKHVLRVCMYWDLCAFEFCDAGEYSWESLDSKGDQTIQS